MMLLAKLIILWCFATDSSMAGLSPALKTNSVATDLAMFKIKTWDDIGAYGATYPQAAREVEVITSTYFATINVTVAMTQLARVGRLLQLAYAGSKGFPCSPMILNILLNYQGLVKNSLMASSHFVESSISALKYHRLAMVFGYKEKFDASLAILKYAYAIAKDMVKECDKLIQLSEKLIKETRDAAVQAVTDQVATEAQKNATLSAIAKDKVNREMQSRRLIELQKAYEIERAEAAKAEREARKNEDAARSKCKRSGWDIFVQVVTFGAVDNKRGCSNEFERKLSADARQRQKDARDKVRAYRKDLIDSNAKEAGLIQSLMNAKVQFNDLKVSVLSLELTVAVLGRVITIFQNARLFWEQVQRMAESRKIGDILQTIADVATIDPDAGKQEYIDQVRDSGFGWIGLAMVNRESALAIRKVNNGVDKIITNLPTTADAKILVNTLGKSMLKEIQKETQKIVAAQKEQEKKRDKSSKTKTVSTR